MKENNNKLRIIITILVSGLMFISLFFIKQKEDKEILDNNKDAIKFKEEYESINGQIAYEKYTYPTISILESNPFKYKNIKEVVDIIKNGTGIIYFGFKKCPWCRNAVNVLQYINSDIYYLDMTDLRDNYEYLNDKITKTKNAPNEYYELLELLDGILDEYEIKDDNQNKIKVGEKRIYVPLVLGIKEGKIVGYHMDTVTLKEGQTPYDILDKEQKEELKKIYDEINTKVFNDTCSLEHDSGC